MIWSLQETQNPSNSSYNPKDGLEDNNKNSDNSIVIAQVRNEMTGQKKWGKKAVNAKVKVKPKAAKFNNTRGKVNARVKQQQ